MAKSGRVAIAELVSRDKEQLVLIRPYRKGLVLHRMYYANEVRDFKQVPKGENVKVSEKELELGVGLPTDSHRRSSSRRITKTNTASACWACWMKRAKAGIVIDKALAPKHGQVLDIMEALKRSMERVPAKKRPKKKKKVS